MKTRKNKKSLKSIRSLGPKGKIDTTKARRLLAGANPWIDNP